MPTPNRPELTEEEYLDIEEAIASDARGRAFLRMREQRARLVAITEVRRLAREVKEALAKTGSKRAAVKNGAPVGATRDDAHFNVLREELREMSAHIAETRREIGALAPPGGNGAQSLAEATADLEDIAAAGEAATAAILSGIERIHVLADMLPKDGADSAIIREIQARALEVVTACTSQDGTAQRTAQLINTLRYVEQRINAMLEIWGLEPPARPEDEGDEEALGGEPASEGPPRQEDIEALFERLKAVQEKAARKRDGDGGGKASAAP